ncbi:hypothetical protein CH35J_003318 [Colletotrichum higginsianum]|uniref:Uncharacterized protein n=1 Tax=Colletotrichum higginsianum TaxID=80884 RepID=A0A4V4NDK1_9PEZI|nr:hypothetical protein CH35J_003318 [Colletotrichum higginsianum]
MHLQTVPFVITLLAAGISAAPIAPQVVTARDIVAPDAYSTRSKWAARIDERDAAATAEAQDITTSEARDIVAPDAYSTRSKWAARIDERKAEVEAHPENVVDCCYSTRAAWTAEVGGEES